MLELISGATAQGASGTLTLRNCPSLFGFQINTTGSPTTVVIDVEGSLDGGITYAPPTQHTLTADIDGFHVSKSYSHIRVTISTLTGGTTPTVTVFVDFNREKPIDNYIIQVA